MSRRIAYVHSRLQLNDARLKFMPFGLNLAQKLDQMGLSLDLYLAEERTEDYSRLFSTRTRVFFLDPPLIWKRPGKVTYHLLHLYFRYLSRKTSATYDAVLSSGQGGNSLGRLLSGAQSCPHILLSDEFPDIYDSPIWFNAEQEAAKNAALLISPDETRVERLKQKFAGIDNIDTCVVPNTPLAGAFKNLPEVDWHSRLKLPEGKKIFLLAGGIYDFNQIAETMFTVQDWPEEAILLINGKPSKWVPRSTFEHLDIPDKIFWHTSLLDEPEFHSLIKATTASFGLYRKVSDLEYVGKSSGKILRSLGCGRPVIASTFNSLDFVTELDVGYQVKHPREIPSAVRQTIQRHSHFQKHCSRVYEENLSFEAYWPQVSLALQKAGLTIPAEPG